MIDRLVAVSPHLDDAVLACGERLAAKPGAVVITVLAGRPPSTTPVTAWDAAAGFRNGDDVMGERRAEDAAALRVLGATPVWLDFLDAQYGPAPDLSTITAALDAALGATAPTAVLIPLGLFHSDHELVHVAALACARAPTARRWIAYEEAMYRRLPDARARRFEALRAAGVELEREPTASHRATAVKRRAISCYRSQLRALQSPGRPGWHDALEPECYWRLRL